MRSEPRISVSHRATLNAGEAWYPCLIQDMSTKGFFIVSSRDHEVGQSLGFRCSFAPEKSLECKLEVRHVNDMGMGAKITDIDEKGATLCRVFLEEQYADQLNRSG